MIIHNLSTGLALKSQGKLHTSSKTHIPPPKKLKLNVEEGNSKPLLHCCWENYIEMTNIQYKWIWILDNEIAKPESHVWFLGKLLWVMTWKCGNDDNARPMFQGSMLTQGSLMVPALNQGLFSYKKAYYWNMEYKKHE